MTGLNPVTLDDGLEWLDGTDVHHPDGTGQVVALAPERGRVWVCDGLSFYDCAVADLARANGEQGTLL